MNALRLRVNRFEGRDNPKYNSVFTAWAAQFDSDEREYDDLTRAGSAVMELFQLLRGRLDSTAQSTPNYGHLVMINDGENASRI